jgi:hypothetical protein
MQRLGGVPYQDNSQSTAVPCARIVDVFGPIQIAHFCVPVNSHAGTGPDIAGPTEESTMVRRTIPSPGFPTISSLLDGIDT